MAEKIDYDFDVKQIDHHEFYKLFLSGPKDQEEMKKASIFNELLKITPAHIVDQIETVYMTDAKSLAMMYAN